MTTNHPRRTRLQHWILTVAVVSGQAAGAADPLNVAPEQWQKKSGSGFVTYSAPGSFETLLYAELPPSVGLAMAVKQVPRFLERMGCTDIDRGPAPTHVHRCRTVSKGTSLELLGAAVRRPEGGSLITVHSAPTDIADAVARQQSLPQRLELYASGRPVEVASAPAAPVAEVPATIVRPTAGTTGAANAALEAIVFDLDYISGVGGFTYPEYTPVYLMKDGRACRCTEFAADEIAWSKVSSKRRGRWQRNGSGYRINYDAGGKPEMVKASVAKPQAVPSEVRLKGEYRAIGGGGNAAMGGSVAAAGVESLTFLANGRFEQTRTSAASSSAGSGFRKGRAGGTFALDGPTLTLNYDDGRRVRTSLLYSSKRKNSAEFGRLGVLWIGGEGFKRSR